MAALRPRRIEPIEAGAFPLTPVLAQRERRLISFRQRGLVHQGRRPLSAACTQTSVGRKTGL